PFNLGFIVTLGALVAVTLGGTFTKLSTVMVSIGAALFIAMALEPLVTWLEKRKLSRAAAIAVVFLGFMIVVGGIIAILVPVAVQQVTQLAKATPSFIASIQNADWFKNFVAASGGGDIYATILAQVQAWLSTPANIIAVAGGFLSISTGVIEFASNTLIVLVLTLYFLASMKSMKTALVRISPAYARPRVAAIADQITSTVGGYVSGMAILATFNAIFAFILLTILGSPYAALLALLALLITMIPMVGPAIAWIMCTIVMLFTSPVGALIFFIVYFIYMQVEAYFLTPKVMSEAVDVPGSLVLIGALVGATLLGLLGALIAVPVTASLLIILKDVYIPKQDAKLVPED
ncbi:MAG TPA: AI-2E family transporter, partial [Propionibacteriaceae bacterium]|nr:AI-2E family transporter [Propionibacteriaceae bacterium]HBY22236.1 AI-2E family transporter [Propionibacteriaceae bacterium]